MLYIVAKICISSNILHRIPIMSSNIGYMHYIDSK